MARAFLSHSSADKKRYVEQVFRTLGPTISVYDEYTFEEGMKSFEEINRGLNDADLFVLFLSNDALESDWVKIETKKAYELLKNGKLERIFPIIVDGSIDYKDRRIPKWMREEYNLKYVSRPTVAARRIEQRLREISWKHHPRLLDKEKIFRGRNDLIKSFEERVDSHDKQYPSTFVASGLRGVGRRALLKHCFRKTGITEDSYKPAVIWVSSTDSVEDFILKVYDLGFSDRMDLTGLLSKDVSEKISIAIKLANDLQSAKEILFIDDAGSLVGKDGLIAEWFLKIQDGIAIKNLPTFAIASHNRPYIQHYRNNDQIFILYVPELDKSERTGLLKRYLDFEDQTISAEEFEIIGSLLKGYPEQIFYAVEMIKDSGITKTLKETHRIVEFNSLRATQVLQKYEEGSRAFKLIVLLSAFEFISYSFLSEIIGDDSEYFQILEELCVSSIVESLGANRDYFRINDAVRDYVTRSRIGIDADFSKNLRKHLEGFLKTYATEEKDASDSFYSIKQALLSGASIDEKFLIPSHFLKTIKELYDKRDYKQVTKLADRALENEGSIDAGIRKDIQYMLCLALAREGHERFLSEAMKLSGAEHLFLLGFYYRLKGRYRDAIEKIKQSLELKNYAPARRELVNVYVLLEEYDLATDLALRNYEEGRTNPYNIQAYFECVLHGSDKTNRNKILTDLVGRANEIKTDAGREMAARLRAKYCADIGDQDSALQEINDALKVFPSGIYLMFAKFEICEKNKGLEEMEKIVATLKTMLGDSNAFKAKLTMMEAKCLALRGKVDAAVRLVEARSNSLPENIAQSMLQKIKRYGSQ